MDRKLCRKDLESFVCCCWEDDEALDDEPAPLLDEQQENHDLFELTSDLPTGSEGDEKGF